MGWFLFEIFINIFQACLQVFFIRRRLHTNNPNRWADIICVLVIAAFLSTALFTDLSVPDILGFVILLLYAFYIAQDRWYVSVYWVTVLAILFYSTINLSIHLLMTIPGLSYKNLMENGYGRLLFIILTNVPLMIIVFSASKLKRDYSKLAWPVLLLFLLMNGSIFAVEEALFSLQIEFEQNGFMIIQQMELLNEMVRAGNNQEAESYLEAYKERISDRREFITGCTAVDALLTVKSLAMRKFGIGFQYSPHPLQELPVSVTDFCTIVGNLLDNAIEGVQRLDGVVSAPIHLAFSRTWDMFYIHCTNPCNPATLIRESGSWRSSKNLNGKPGLHAIGIRSIEKIVELAQGRCSFEAQANTFKVQIVLPFPSSSIKGFNHETTCREANHFDN